MARFVVLEHDHPNPHLDFMLEVGPALWTWRLDLAFLETGESGAVRIGDHRLAYLEYEGPVSGGRGTVRRRDRGTFTWQEQACGRLVVQVEGERLRGLLILTQEGGDQWNVQRAGA